MKPAVAIFLAASLSIVVAGCDADQQPPQNGARAANGAGDGNAVADSYVPGAEAADAELRLASGGLQATPTSSSPARTITFGMPRAQVVAAIGAILGTATGEGANDECGAGPMQFASFGTLTLNFQEGAFVGWSLSGPPGAPPLRSATGLGVGTPRDQIMGEGQGPLQVSETSLGTQFDANGIIGLLSGPEPNATVTDLWAGTNCIFH